MSSSLFIDFSQLTKASDKLKSLEKELIAQVDERLDAGAIAIEAKAKENAPVNFGGLRAAISADNSKLLEKHITVNVFYSAYLEFGTGKYAAQYVGTLPQTWQEYARQFKGSGNGQGSDKFFENILAWVKAKGIRFESAGTFKTGKKKGQNKQLTIEQTAYFIFQFILFNGIHPHPFLFPAYEQQRDSIIKEVEEVIKNIGLK